LLNNSIGGNGVPKQSIGAVGVLGFFVTLGLFFYELRGIQQCNRLIEVGKSIEGCLNIRGQFLHSIDPPRYIISHTFAARVIYPAVLAAWAFLTAFFFTGLNSKNGIAWWQWCFLIVVPLVVILVFFVGSFKVDLEGHLDKAGSEKSSLIVLKMLDAITLKMQADSTAKAKVEELKKSLENLSQDKDVLSLKDWRELSKLMKRLNPRRKRWYM
jgi:hypothetical protein